MKYISLDIETTGLDSKNHQVLSVGAVYDDLSNKEVIINRLPRWECIVRRPTIVGDPFALAMNKWILDIMAMKEGDYRKQCAEKGEMPIPILDYYNVGVEFSEWLHKIGWEKFERVNFVGKNFTTFDKAFLEKDLDWAKHVWMPHRFLDVGSLYFQPTMKGPPSTDECVMIANTRKAGSVYDSDKHDHLGDACRVIQLIRNHYGLNCHGWFSRIVDDLGHEVC